MKSRQYQEDAFQYLAASKSVDSVLPTSLNTPEFDRGGSVAIRYLAKPLIN